MTKCNNIEIIFTRIINIVLYKIQINRVYRICVYEADLRHKNVVNKISILSTDEKAQFYLISKILFRKTRIKQIIKKKKKEKINKIYIELVVVQNYHCFIFNF